MAELRLVQAILAVAGIYVVVAYVIPWLVNGFSGGNKHDNEREDSGDIRRGGDDHSAGRGGSAD